MIRSLIIIFCLVSFCFAKDSVSVTAKQVKEGCLTKTITAYDADAVLYTITITNGGVKLVSLGIAAEMTPYIKNPDQTVSQPPFMSANLTWTMKDLGKDSVKVIDLYNLMKTNLKTRNTLK